MKHVFNQGLFILAGILMLSNCSNKMQGRSTSEIEANRQQNELACRSMLEKHLDAVSNKDLATLKTTLVPEGDFYFVMPQSIIRTKVEDFIKEHEAWFKDKSWSFETRILSLSVGSEVAFAVVEIVYREPERNGAPYFNRMAVSYGMKKIKGRWYVAKDHACSLDKTKPK